MDAAQLRVGGARRNVQPNPGVCSDALAKGGVLGHRKPVPVRQRKYEVIAIEGLHGRQDNGGVGRGSIGALVCRGIAFLVVVAVGFWTPAAALLGQEPTVVIDGLVVDAGGPVFAADVTLEAAG